MKNFYSRLFIVLPLFGLLSCSEDPSNASLQSEKTSQDSSLIQNPSSLKPFDPDPFWTTLREVVSQYGPPDICRDVVIDHNGTIWMASWAGVVSYNGKEFTNHTLKEGLAHHRVYSVLEDSKGNMWFGTMGAGAYEYDGVTFTNISSNNGMADNVVMDLFEDAKGNIWFATNKGVSMFNGKTIINLDSACGINGAVYSISEDKSGLMWFGGESGLFQYRPDAQNPDIRARECLTSYSTPYSNVRDLYFDGTAMWIGAASGLYTIDRSKEENFTARQVTQNFTGYIHSDLSGHLLLTSTYISRYDGSTDTPLTASGNNLGLFGAREATDGTIWYGAMDGLHSVKDGKDVVYKKP